MKSLGIPAVCATLTVKQERKGADGASTSTMTQNFKIDGAACRISR